MNIFPVNPDLKTLLDNWKDYLFDSMNCHALGTIQKFNVANQTAEITLNYPVSSFDSNGVESSLEYPVLIDCPVIILAGGAGALTFPVTPGDTCLILFNDKDIDNWWYSGQKQPLNTPRKHAFTDAIALVGLRSRQNAITDYASDKTQLRYGTTKVTLGAKIKLQNNSTDLLTSLNVLISALDTFFTATSSAAVEPSLGPAASAAKTAVANFKTTLEGLLE